MLSGSVRATESVPRVVWKRLPGITKAVLVGKGLVSMENGLPVVHGEMLLRSLRDIARAVRESDNT